MPRSGEEARRRLETAALELYREHGFDRTTTAQIAKHAGVTERTFFHHFRDKREVLFAGEERLRGVLVAAIDAAPGELAPLDVLQRAFCALEQVMEDGRSYAEPRQELIAATPALHERETAKLASLADALAAALGERGIDGRRATLAAHSGMAAFVLAVGAWYADSTEGFPTRVAEAFDDLRRIGVAEAGGTPV